MKDGFARGISIETTHINSAPYFSRLTMRQIKSDTKKQTEKDRFILPYL
ncbi:MAG: hypothetical protein WCS87_05675 [Methylococcaceae bacterium]